MTESTFNESLDGAERAGNFLVQLATLMRAHRVQAVGDLRHVELHHDSIENGWSVDMQDVQTVVDGKTR